MSSRVIPFRGRSRNVLNGYDLLAKSFPGMALLVGLASFLPSGESITVGKSLIASLATFLIIIALLGFLIGEAVHTLAETIEKWIFKPVYVLGEGYKRLRIYITNYTSKTPPSAYERHIDDVKPSQKFKIISFWNLNLVFKQHRELLIDLIQENYKQFLGYMKKGEKGELFDDFSRTIQSEYGIDITENPNSLSFLYPSIMSKIYMSQARLSKRFQIIFSFCRSMWMTFLILSLGYSYVIFIGNPLSVTIPYGGQYTPIIVMLIKDTPLPAFVIPLSTLLTTIGFLAACGKYKYHYIEYIIADFPYIMNSKNDGMSQIDTSGGA